MDNYKILKTKTSPGYELIDSGDGEKLERFGEYILRRPDPQALWQKNLELKDWKGAIAYFERQGESGKWKKKENMPAEWTMDFAGLKFLIKPTAFKHTGLFPEHEENWSWIKEQILKANRPIKVLNLFGYTGGASLAAAQAGAEVIHVDSSKSAIAWAKKNAELSGLDKKPIRWLEDDARKFVQREIKRGNTYDAIIMDPPAFGHGANKEIWKIEEDFNNLLNLCSQILSSEPSFVLVNGYSAGYSALAYENSLMPFVKKYGLSAQAGGSIEKGELTIEESDTGRLLPAGIFARWTK